MDNRSFDDKSFVPQLLLDGEPSSEWGPDELGRYAQAQNQQINDSEKLLSPVYWRMGKTLTLAKKHFDHGQWTKFLESWGIDRTRAAKARAIFGAFESEQAVLGLSVEEAYGQRKRRAALNPGEKHGRSRDERKLNRFAASVGRRAEALIDEAAFVAPEAANSLLPQIDQAIKRLQRLRDWLVQQAKVKSAALVAGSADANPGKRKSPRRRRSAPRHDHRPLQPRVN